MSSFSELVGAFLQNVSARSGQNRMGNALEEIQRQDPGDAAATRPGGSLVDNVMEAVKGGLSSAAQNPIQAGGIGAVLGSLIGGGGDSIKGAIGGGALAMLAGVAVKALMNAGQREGDSAGLTGATLPPGLKAPQTPDEHQALEHTAALVLKAMINAAKSDGEIDAQEVERIVGKLKESGMDEGAQHWVMTEMRKPLDVNAFAAEIPSPEVAAEVYAASLLAIEVDTDAERTYLRQLAERTGLNPAVVQYINRTMGVA